MKDFDLEAAKRGAAVCTRSGRKVRILCYDKKGESPIVAVVDFENHENQYEYDENGTSPYLIQQWLTLMMRDDDYLEKLERGEYQSGQIRLLYENPSNSMPLNLTKREWFAGMAMAGEISGCLAAGNGFDGDKSIPGIIAKSSVMIADAMIEELEKTEK